MKLRQQLQSIDSDHSIDLVEKAKRKQNLLMLHSLTFSTSTTPSPVANQQPTVSTMSPLAPAFYPPGDTVGSVVGKIHKNCQLMLEVKITETCVKAFIFSLKSINNPDEVLYFWGFILCFSCVYLVGHALDDLNLDDIDINSIDRELDKDEVNSLSSSLSAGIPTSGIWTSTWMILRIMIHNFVKCDTVEKISFNWTLSSQTCACLY